MKKNRENNYKKAFIFPLMLISLFLGFNLKKFYDWEMIFLFIGFIIIGYLMGIIAQWIGDER